MANHVRELREELARRVPGGYSQAELARRLGVATNTVQAWESGRSKPRKAMARRLARALGVKVEELELEPVAAVQPVIVAAIVPHPGNQQEVLMTERRFATERVWSWPAGHVREGEDPATAVLRELNEELVVQDARLVRHLDDVVTRADVSRWWGHRFRHGYRMLHFQVEIASPVVKVIDHEELVRAEWLSLDQVSRAVAALPVELAEAAVRFFRLVLTGETIPDPSDTLTRPGGGGQGGRGVGGDDPPPTPGRPVRVEPHLG